MSLLPAPLEPIRPALLTRTSPASRLAVAICWLFAALVASSPLVPALLVAVGSIAIALGSGLPLSRIPGRLAPLIVAALGLGVLALIAHPSGADRGVAAIAIIGPVRLTEPALGAALALVLRLGLVAVTTLLVFAVSDATQLADALAQQLRMPDRVTYGTLAALRLAPLLAADWAATGAARRLRGLDGTTPWSLLAGVPGRLLVLLVSAIRRAERVALAMDARGFDTGGPRTRYRPARFAALDLLLLVAGLAAAAAALLAGAALGA
ncbi:MAG: energy-coupling factor transporter transmembrane protein EcfT [Chloroflexi bacterium]|nr:energy-coupling factor transporter transmembrane protein EcfT [Chloroflexota bacterium]